MEYKWYPGFNDEVIETILGEEVDYTKVKVLAEWTSGTLIIDDLYE